MNSKKILWIVVVAFIAGAIGGIAAGYIFLKVKASQTQYAGQFVLVDKYGHSQALLGLVDGVPKLMFFDAKRNSPMVLTPNFLTFNEPDKKNSVQVGLEDSTGLPKVFLQENGGSSLGTLLSHGLAFGDINKPHILMSDSSVSSQKKGAHFLIADKNGKPIWVAPGN